MSVLIAFINIGLLLIMSFLTDGSARYFNVDKKKGLVPVTVTFSAKDLQAAGLAKKFVWNFGDGESITTTNTSITHTYTTAGVYTAKLQYLAKTTDALSKAKDGGSVKIEATAPINILPTASLTCVSNVLNSLECNANGSADTDGTIVSYKYEWGDGTDSTSTNANSVTHTYSTSGSKTVKLTVKDNKDGVGLVEKTFNLKENSAPVASFTCQKTGIQKIHCESTSSDADETLSQFNWTLPDGASFTTASFDHTFSRPQDIAIASHNIQLQVTDSLGLTSTTSQNVAVDLEVIKESPRGYFKVFEMGTTLELHSFIAKTQFAPKRAFYQIYGASEQELLQTIEIPEFYPNTVIKADIGSFRPGRIFLTIIDWRDQIFKTSIPFSLVEDTTALKPFVEFRAIQSARRTVYLNLNLAFDFDLDFAIKSFNINFGDGQQVELTNDTFLTHTYAAAGTYQVSVTAITNHNTQATITKNVTVTDNDLPAVNPDATFGYRIFSYAQNVSFYNEKSGTPNGEIISYMWDFGDGSTGTGATQSHFYEPGTYLVSLTVTDTAGLTNTQTQKVTIKADGADLLAGIDCSLQLPYLDFTQKCKVLALDRFNQISRVRVLWGDGTVSVLGTPFDANQGIYFPSKKYTTAGLYSVKVVVNTTRGDVAGFETSLNIVARPPIASIQCYSNNLAVYCDALGSYDPKGSQLSYEFNFGNGHIETNQTGVISYAYPEAGLYDVSVKVTDTQGMSGSSTTKVQAVRPPNQLPVANFNCDSPQPYTIFCWEESIYDPDGTITIKKLSFDDGDYGFLNSNETTRHQFTTSGQHEVTLTVMDNDGGVTTVTKMIEVKKNNPPRINSIECYNSRAQTLDCYADANDPDSGDGIISYEWEMGDNSQVHSTTFPAINNYRYTSAGTKTVNLVVKDKYGAVSSKVGEFTVNESQPPVANFSCSEISVQKIGCTSHSYSPDGEVKSYVWKIDGLVSYSGNSFIHKFDFGENHNVTLTVKDEFEKEGSLSKEIQIRLNKLPIFSISASVLSGPPPLRVTFTAKDLKDLDGSIANLKWTFEEGEESEGEEVEYTFESVGNYRVKLEVTDNDSSVVEKFVDIQVAYPISGTIASTKDSILVGELVSFSLNNLNDPNGEIVKIEWFSDDEKIGEGSSLNFRFDTVGAQNVVAVITNANGGVQNLYKEIQVNPSDFYVEGLFPEIAFIGRKYTARFSQAGNKEFVNDTSFELVGAPENMTIEEDGIIEWIPDSSDQREIVFKLRAMHDSKVFYKQIRIKTFELQSFFNQEITGNSGGSVSLDLGGLIGRVVINYPKNEVNYSLKIYKAVSIIDNDSRIKIETTPKIKVPVEIYFENNKLIQSRLDFKNSKSSETFDYYSSYPIPSKIKIVTGKVKQCAEQFENDIYNEEIKYGTQPSLNFLKHQDTDNSNHIYITSDVDKNSEDYKKLLSILDSLSFESSGIEFWITNERPKINGYASAPSNKPNLIVISLKELKSVMNNVNFIKYVIYHESFHIRQTEMIGCQTSNQSHNSARNGIDELIEGAADYYALKRFALQSDREDILKIDYDIKKHRTLYDVSNKILNSGLVRGGYPYAGRVFWEYSPINMYTFFQKYGEELSKNSENISGKRVIEILKESENPEYESWMGATTLGDALVNVSQMYNNFNRLEFSIPSYSNSFPITNYLYNKELLTGLPGGSPYQNKDYMGRDIKNLILGAKKGNSKEFKLRIPPLGTRSVKISEFGPGYEGSFASQMNAMIRISYEKPNDNITAKIVSMVEASNGALGSLREFKKSVRENDDEEVFIGSRGNRYSGKKVKINQIVDGGFNTKGLEYYNQTLKFPYWWENSDMWNYVWNDGTAIQENILMDFANTSDETIDLTVKIEPLCSRKRVPNLKDFPYQELSFSCTGNCLTEKTINVCWEGRSDYFLNHDQDHCMFGNTNAMNSIESGDAKRYQDRNYTGWYGSDTTYYVCGEDSESSELGRLNVRHYKNFVGDE